MSAEARGRGPEGSVWAVVHAAEAILEFVDDPDAVAQPTWEPAIYVIPLTRSQQLRAEADRVVAQSKAVRRLRAALAALGATGDGEGRG